MKQYLKSRSHWIVLLILILILNMCLDIFIEVNTTDLMYRIFLIISVFLLILCYDMSHYYYNTSQIKKISGYDVTHLYQPTAVETACLQMIQEKDTTYQMQATMHQDQLDSLHRYYTLWAHQIKTPLAAMKLLLETAQMKHETRIAIQNEYERIRRYVELVLQYVRVQSIHEDIIIEPCDIDSLIKKVLKQYAIFFSNQNLKLEYTAVNLQYATDKKWFSLVLDQLISNAVKYTRDGYIKIYLQDDVLIIEDSGKGIAAKHMPQLFEFAFTGQNGREQQHATGLGLYIAKRSCDMLGIELALSSIEGEGVRAMLTLKKQEKHLT